MSTGCLDMVVDPEVLRLMGFGSSIIGFICFALGSTFQKLFGGWNLSKIVVYCIVSSMFSLFMLYANYFGRRFPRVFLLKAVVSFLVMVLGSLFSYYDDGGKEGESTAEGKGHRSIWSLISFGSFALMSMSLSTQVQPGFEVGMSNFFLGCLVLGVMKKNFLVGLAVALLCFMVMSIRFYSDFRQQQRRRGGVVELDGIVVVRDDLREETQLDLSPLPLTNRPSPSLSTLRRRPVNSECSVILNTPSPILRRQISLKALSYVSLSASEYWTLLRSEWGFTQSLPHLRLRSFWLPESRALIPSNDQRLPQLMGPDDEL